VRPLESLILVTLFLSLFGRSFPSIKRSRLIDLLPSLAALLTVIHLALERYRWQMVPAYGLTFLLFLLSLPRIVREDRPTDKGRSRRVLMVAGSLLMPLIFMFAAALPVLLPVFRLPEPTGPFLVGTTKLHLMDRTRAETFTPDPNDHRELVVQVWYPAEVAPGARRATYMEEAPLQFSHLSLVRTHSTLDAPISDAQSSYPVLVFSHGYIGFIDQNLTQMEELASHGYVVCSIAHPYHAVVTLFPDGRVVPVDSTLVNQFMAGAFSARDMAAHLRIWMDDTVFLIDELEGIQAGEPGSTFAGRLDMAQLGLFGNSFGGTTAVEVCALDDRCQAGVNLDGGAEAGSTLKQPFLFLMSLGRAGVVRRALNAAEDAVYWITVRGATHLDFCDVSLYSPVFKYTGFLGPIDGRRMVRVMNEYTLAFFDKHLKGKSSPLLDGCDPGIPCVEIVE
jgi:predicted dienelactone hydrolase